MLGVGGTRSNLGRKALRAGRNNDRVGGAPDPRAQKRELLRKLQEKQARAQQREQQREEREEQRE
ncbi:DUF6243 family protein [Streptomyces sp. NPDC002643]